MKRFYATVVFILIFSGCNNSIGQKSTTANLSENDTEKISGNFILFLRPSDEKFNAAKEEAGLYEYDSDFGFAIQNTIDSLEGNSKFAKIGNEVSTKRHIQIENCVNCPELIDRDSIWYGLILSAPNKKFKIITNVQPLGYLSEIEEYFK